MKAENKAMIEQEVERLRKLAEELGAKVGLYKLTVSFVQFVESKLRSLAVKLFGEISDPAILRERIDLLQKLQQKENETVENYLAKYQENIPSQGMSGSSHPINWRHVITVALGVALLGLILSAFGMVLSPLAWTILGVCAALLVLHAAMLPVRLRQAKDHLSDYLIYLFARKRYRKLGLQVSELSEQILTEQQTWHEVEEWVSLNKAVILSHFELNKAIAERAAQLTEAEETRFSPDEFALNSH